MFVCLGYLDPDLAFCYFYPNRRALWVVYYITKTGVVQHCKVFIASRTLHF